MKIIEDYRKDQATKDAIENKEYAVLAEYQHGKSIITITYNIYPNQYSFDVDMDGEGFDAMGDDQGYYTLADAKSAAIKFIKG